MYHRYATQIACHLTYSRKAKLKIFTVFTITYKVFISNNLGKVYFWAWSLCNHLEVGGDTHSLEEHMCEEMKFWNTWLEEGSRKQLESPAQSEVWEWWGQSDLFHILLFLPQQDVISSSSIPKKTQQSLLGLFEIHYSLSQNRICTTNMCVTWVAINEGVGS